MTEAQKKSVQIAAENAKAIQCRDDVCSRSTMAGLASVFDFIPKEMITASASLCGGTGSASGSCGAYCSGLLAVGLKFNSTIEEEQANLGEDVFGPSTGAKFSEYRDRFLAEVGTILCPKIHEKLFGRSYVLSDPKDQQEFFGLEGHVEKCSEIVAIAARIAAEMIVEGDEKDA